jgi:hypothetical protein
MIVIVLLLVLGTCAGYNAAKVKSAMGAIKETIGPLKKNIEEKKYEDASADFKKLADIHKTLLGIKPMIGDAKVWDEVQNTSITAALQGADACAAKDDEGMKKALEQLLADMEKGHGMFIKK